MKGVGVEREGRAGSSQCFLPLYVALPKRKGDSVTALAGRHEACMRWGAERLSDKPLFAGWISRRRVWGLAHTPNIAFRHLPPNSARVSYATEGALFIFRRSCPATRASAFPKGSGTNMTVEAKPKRPKHARKHETYPPPGKKTKKRRVPSRFKRLWFYLCWV